MKFADPKNDLAFKKIFDDENYKNILMNNLQIEFTGLKV